MKTNTANATALKVRPSALKVRPSTAPTKQSPEGQLDLLLIKTDTVASMTSLSIRTIKRLVSENSIPHIRIGYAVRFHLNAIRKWITDGCPRRTR